MSVPTADQPVVRPALAHGVSAGQPRRTAPTPGQPRCSHYADLYGRCMDCGMTWRQRAEAQHTAPVDQVSAATKQRVRTAIRFVHALTCHRGHRDPAPCPSCPKERGMLGALKVLDRRPADAAAARRTLHDAVCMGVDVGDCPPESDHADRTQASTVVALRRFRLAEAFIAGERIAAALEALAPVLALHQPHREQTGTLACPTCLIDYPCPTVQAAGGDQQ